MNAYCLVVADVCVHGGVALHGDEQLNAVLGGEVGELGHVTSGKSASNLVK